MRRRLQHPPSFSARRGQQRAFPAHELAPLFRPLSDKLRTRDSTKPLQGHKEAPVLWIPHCGPEEVIALRLLGCIYNNSVNCAQREALADVGSCIATCVRGDTEMTKGSATNGALDWILCSQLHDTHIVVAAMEPATCIDTHEGRNRPWDVLHATLQATINDNPIFLTGGLYDASRECPAQGKGQPPVVGDTALAEICIAVRHDERADYRDMREGLDGRLRPLEAIDFSKMERVTGHDTEQHRCGDMVQWIFLRSDSGVVCERLPRSSCTGLEAVATLRRRQLDDLRELFSLRL